MQFGRRSGSTLKTRLSLLFPPSPTPTAPKSRGSNQFFSTIRKGRAEANVEEGTRPAPLTRRRKDDTCMQQHSPSLVMLISSLVEKS